mmetsp:Transcript_9601/g.40219  ORF Transcript_9601/g.40219 Transcript_9601/m.40219 type:complete len:208 (+) Transcript_9601:472-1095(+)
MASACVPPFVSKSRNPPGLSRAAAPATTASTHRVPAPSPPSSASAGSCRTTSGCRCGTSADGMYGGLETTPPKRSTPSASKGSNHEPTWNAIVEPSRKQPCRLAFSVATAIAAGSTSTACTTGASFESSPKTFSSRRATSRSSLATAMASAPEPVPRSAHGARASSGERRSASATKSTILSVSGRGMSVAGVTTSTRSRQWLVDVRY